MVIYFAESAKMVKTFPVPVIANMRLRIF